MSMGQWAQLINTLTGNSQINAASNTEENQKREDNINKLKEDIKSEEIWNDEFIWDIEDGLNNQKCQDLLEVARRNIIINFSKKSKDEFKLSDIYDGCEVIECENVKCKNRNRCWLKYECKISIWSHRNDMTRGSLTDEEVSIIDTLNGTRCYLQVLNELKDYKSATIELVENIVKKEADRIKELDTSLAF